MKKITNNLVTVTITDNNSIQNTAGSQEASSFGKATSAPVIYSITITDLFGVVYYNSKQTGNTITIPVNNSGISELQQGK